MLDSKTSKQLETKVIEQLNIDQSNGSGISSIAESISIIAIRATILTLREYEKLNNENPE